jgi:hypothetical protein
MTIILSFLAVIMLIIGSDRVYEYYQYNGQVSDRCHIKYSSKLYLEKIQIVVRIIVRAVNHSLSYSILND